MTDSDSEPVYCGVDLGGTSAKLVLGDASGRIMTEAAFPTMNDGAPDKVLPAIVDTARQMMKTEGVARLTGLGMGVPGLVDVDSGTTRFLPNLPTHWRDIEVGLQLEQQLECDVRVMNDARAATLGELRFGFGRQSPRASFAFFTIGTGIGGGLVIDGELRLGEFGAAGELGHQTILPDGPMCGCGNRGCLEALASGPSIAAEGMRLMRMGLAPTLAKIVENDLDRVTPETMNDASAEDPLVAKALRRAATYLGIAVANVITIVHPEAVILGGGVSKLGTSLLEPIRKVVQQRVGMFPTDEVLIACSRLEDQAGRFGTLALAMDSPP